MASPSSVLSIVVLVAGVALLLVVHNLVVFWALRQGLGARASSEAEARAEDGGGGGSQGLSADELDNLRCYDFKEKTGIVGGGGNCVVCLEAFEDGDRLRRLPRCGHSFHAPCVDSWLRKSRWCPVCRADVVDRSKGELKLAAREATGDVEIAERSPASPVTLEIAAERYLGSMA